MSPAPLLTATAQKPYMEFLGLLLIFLASIILIIVAFTMVSTLRKSTLGISKDYAEQIVMRRHMQGLVLGARFAREGYRWVWEFDVMDEGEIHRISVDARTAAITKNVIVRAVRSPSRQPTRMLGKKIG